MSIAVMREIDCHFMISSSLAEDIAALSAQWKAIATAAAGWIGPDIGAPRTRRRTNCGSVVGQFEFAA